MQAVHGAGACAPAISRAGGLRDTLPVAPHARARAGELVWCRDCAADVRPVLLEAGGMGVLASLIEGTNSERVRLRALVVCRRLLYEVGSTGRMDPNAIEVGGGDARALACTEGPRAPQDEAGAHACDPACAVLRCLRAGAARPFVHGPLGNSCANPAPNPRRPTHATWWTSWSGC